MRYFFLNLILFSKFNYFLIHFHIKKLFKIIDSKYFLKLLSYLLYYIDKNQSEKKIKN